MSDRSTEKVAIDRRVAGREIADLLITASHLHSDLGELQAHVTPKDAHDLAAARVYIEAAFWKLETALIRQESTTSPEVSTKNFPPQGGSK